MPLTGKRSVITGAASGIGRATAELFAREGSLVFGLDRDAAALAEVIGGLTAVEGGEHGYAEVDVSSPASVAAAFDRVDAAFGRIDALVNAAGVRGVGDPLETTAEEWALVIDVNLSGSFYCAQQAGRRMAAQDGGGAIVNVASTAGIAATNRRLPYNVSKHGVIGLTQSLALDLGEHGIRANAVCPGLTRTPLTDPYFEDEAWTQTVEGSLPLGRVGEPADQAAACAFLCSDAAGYVTGVAFPVDGGMLAGRPLGANSGSAFTTERRAG